MPRRRAENTRRYIGKRLIDPEQQDSYFATRRGIHRPDRRVDDGRFLTFSTGALLLVPLDASIPPVERKAIEWLREEYDVAQGRFSPDGRSLAFLSNEAGGEAMDVYVRSFDATKPQAPRTSVRVSSTGALGMIVWRQDRGELYYMTSRWEVMAVEITTTPTFAIGTPRRLFTAPGPLIGTAPVEEREPRRPALHVRPAG